MNHVKPNHYYKHPTPFILKTLCKSIVRKIVENNTLWEACEQLIRITAFATQARADALFARHFPGDQIRHGFFAGIRIPNGGYAKGSCLIPKFVGTYEAELKPVVDEIVRRNPPVIVDVGCAEGYYAVGFAMRCPQVKVHAFDTSPEARKLCKETAIANKVDDRVAIAGECSPADLLNLPLPVGSLVMSDCEGYEVDLFTDEVVRHLAASLVFIEVHDCYRPEASPTLKTRFSATHDLQVIRSGKDKSDFQSALSHSDFTPAMKSILCHERDFNMDWFFFTPKTANP